MASDAAIIAKMRAAGVPPHAFMHSLDKLGQKQFANIVQKRLFDMGVGGLVSYLIRSESRPINTTKLRNVAMVCAVAAKELVLLGRTVTYIALPELIRAGRNDDDIDGRGRGYWVIPDLGGTIANWQPHEWETAQALMMSHINRGGALILGDTGVIEGGYFGIDLQNALTVFQTVRVE